MKCKVISVATSRNAAAVFLQVHIHLDSNNQKKKQRTDLWNSSSAKKQGTGLSSWGGSCKSWIENYSAAPFDSNKRNQLKTSQSALFNCCEQGVLELFLKVT